MLQLVVIANNFEIKPALITMIQTLIPFGGHLNDDPHVNINNFMEICDTLKINKVGANAIWLRIFPFSL